MEYLFRLSYAGGIAWLSFPLWWGVFSLLMSLVGSLWRKGWYRCCLKRTLFHSCLPALLFCAVSISSDFVNKVSNDGLLPHALADFSYENNDSSVQATAARLRELGKSGLRGEHLPRLFTTYQKELLGLDKSFYTGTLDAVMPPEQPDYLPTKVLEALEELSNPDALTGICSPEEREKRLKDLRTHYIALMEEYRTRTLKRSTDAYRDDLQKCRPSLIFMLYLVPFATMLWISILAIRDIANVPPYSPPSTR